MRLCRGRLTHEFDDSILPGVSVPFSVNVVVLGEGGGHGEEDAALLERSLQSILPSYSFGHHHSTMHLSMRFNVLHTASLLPAYHEFIGSMPQDKEGVHLITIEQLGQFWHNQLEGGNGMHRPIPSLRASFLSLPVLIVTASRDLPPHLIYSLSPLQCTQSAVLGVAVMDLTARSCDLLPSISSELFTASSERPQPHVRWSTPSLSDPWPMAFAVPRTQGLSSQQQQQQQHSPQQDAAMRAHFLSSRLAGVVTSAVEALVVAPEGWTAAHESDRIFCPIIILQSAAIKGQTQEGAETSAAAQMQTHSVHPNIALLTTWLRSLLLPNHEVTLLHSTHFIEDHPQVSVALSNAVKVDPPTGRPLVDSAQLLHELAQNIGDALCEQLLRKAGHSLVELMALEKEAAQGKQHFFSGDPFASLDEHLPPTPTIDVENDDGPDEPQKLAERKETERLQQETVAKAERAEQRRRAKKKLLKGSFQGGRSLPHHERPARIVPVFVLSGMMDSSLNETLLLDGQFHTVVHGDTVLALSPPSASLADINSGIATGLTEALTGLKPPHLQLISGQGRGQRRPVIDLTWTHGSHPFPPFSYLHAPPVHAPEAPPAAEPSDADYLQDHYGSFYSSQYIYKDPPRVKYEYVEDAGVVQWSAKRSVLLARLLDSVRRCKLTWHRGRAITDRLQGVLHMLQGTLAASPDAPKVESKENMPQHELGVFTLSAELRNALPVSTIRLLNGLQTDMNAIAAQMQTLVDSLGSDGEYAEAHKVVSAIEAFDTMMATTDASLHSLEGDLIDELSGCRIAFAGDAIRNSRRVSRKTATSSFSLVLPLLCGLLLLVGVAVVLFRVQRSLEKRVKKLQ